MPRWRNVHDKRRERGFYNWNVARWQNWSRGRWDVMSLHRVEVVGRTARRESSAEDALLTSADLGTPVRLPSVLKLLEVCKLVFRLKSSSWSDVTLESTIAWKDFGSISLGCSSRDSSSIHCNLHHGHLALTYRFCHLPNSGWTSQKS